MVGNQKVQLNICYRWLLSLLVLLFITGCNSDKDPILGLEPVDGLQSILLSPQNPALAAGLTQQFTALGVYANGTSLDISDKVTLSSATAAVSTINSQGLATALQPGTSVITASFAGKTANTLLTVTSAVLSSISISPQDVSVADGLTTQFIATGLYSDGSTENISSAVNWLSSDTSIATMNPGQTALSGLATAVAPGSTDISATLGGGSATTRLTVTDAILMSIQLTPVNTQLFVGVSQQYSATGVYSDGSSQDISALVSWASSAQAIAAIDSAAGANHGLASGLAAGTSQISATLGAVSAETTLTVNAATLSSIVVTPLVSTVTAGLSRQFVATANYSDGSSFDVSRSVVWASADTQIATMNANGAVNSGLATGQAAGAVQISATLGSISGAATLTVTNASLSSISVTPLNPSVVDGLTRQFNATGTYSDGSTADLTPVANWTSGTIAVASMNASLAANSGLATGLSAGTSLIRASFAGLEGSTTLTVTAATLTAIEVTPENASAVVNETEQFIATGVYTDGSRINISSTVVWTSSNTGVAVMNANGQPNSGLATAMAAGSSAITATSGAVQDSAVLTVTAALANNPQAPAMGELQRFIMIASQAITTTTGSAVADGDMAILDLARTAYAGFTAGPVAGQFTQLTNGVSYAADDTSPPYVVPVPYASMVAFINQVRTDLGVAATFLAADPNPAAATQALPAELGGLVITRGVYRNAGNVIIQQGNLTLDAQGDPDSVFIFVIAGTFTTGAPGGNIVLTGGAQAKNVFWRTGGATVFGSNTSFAGNVFAWPQINLGTGTAVTGRLFSVTEQVTLDANAVTKPQ